MTHAQAQSRHAQLAAEIRRHDHAYYVDAKPTVSDREYDTLFAELLALEKEFPDLTTSDSPSQRVGGAPSEGFKSVKHLQPMLSLEKTTEASNPDSRSEPDWFKRSCMQDVNTLPELVKFDDKTSSALGRERVEYVMEPKVDGVSISAHYRYGKLALGVTRGDGQFGDDITANLRTIRSVPLQLDMPNPPALLEVRGEAFIAIKDFNELNEQLKRAGKEAFPNARNAAAGILKQKNSHEVATRPIRAVFYSVGACEGIKFATHAQMLASLKKAGLPTQEQWWLCAGIEAALRIYSDEVVANYDGDRDLRTRLPYEIDGVVLKVNDLADCERIGLKTRAPGWAIVHKPIPWIRPAETVLRAITVQVGRTGVLTPVAELEPVFVQGSTIARATLHNEDEIRRKDIRIGDTVIIRKAGMVIPEVLEVVKTKRPPGAEEFDLFKHIGGKCPACGGKINRDPRYRVYARCTNTAKDENSRRFVCAYESEDLSLVGQFCPKCGEKSGCVMGRKADFPEWLCDNVASCPAQLVRRVEFFASRKALDLEGLGGIVAEKLIERGLVSEPLDVFNLKLPELAALNLGADDEPRMFGDKNARKLLEAVRRSRTMPLSRWLLALAIPEIGAETAREVARYFADFRSIPKSDALKDCAAFAELLLAINENVVPREWMQQGLSEEDMRTRREKQKELKALANPLGERLIRAGFAIPSPTAKSQPWQALTLVGPSAARSLLAWFKSEQGCDTVRRLDELGVNPKGEQVPSVAAPLTGKTVVLTGTLPTLAREEAAILIRDAGGSVSGSVSKNTDFVLAGENAGSKLDKARDLGIPVINEDEFRKMLGGGEVPKPVEQGMFRLE